MSVKCVREIVPTCHMKDRKQRYRNPNEFLKSNDSNLSVSVGKLRCLLVVARVTTNSSLKQCVVGWVCPFPSKVDTGLLIPLSVHGYSWKSELVPDDCVGIIIY